MASNDIKTGRTILGIDPGLNITGWGIIAASGNHLRYIACGTISPPAKEALAKRLLFLHHGLSQIIDIYKPDECAIEETFVNSNALSSLKLGHARGSIMLTVAQAFIPVTEYAATLVKKTVVGVGRAEKQQIILMVKQLLPGCTTTSEDAADSLAVAICHTSHARFRNKTEGK